MQRRGLIRTLIAVALGAASPATAAPVAGSGARAGTHCGAMESVLYSARFTHGRTGSVCVSRGAVHYRYGRLGAPEIDLVSAADWSNVHYGEVRGGGNGYQRHVRFTAAGINYVIFEGVAGELTDIAGQRSSGIYVGREDSGGTWIGARSGEILAESWGAILRREAPAAMREGKGLDEVRDGPFSGWF